MRTSTLLKQALGLSALLVLAACGPLVSFGEDGPPAQRFTLAHTPASIPAPARSLGVIRVEDMEVPAELALERILVRPNAQEVRYAAGGRWTDRPNRLMRALLIDTLDDLSGVTVLGPAQIDVPGDLRVTGRLSGFHIEVRNGTRQAVVTLEALLIARQGSRLIAARTFNATAPVGSDRPADYAAALNVAANSVATGVVGWIIAQEPTARP